MVAVVIEPFFVTNQDEGDKYTNEGSTELAKAIVKGISNYLN